jgi:hypothetical protein
MASRQSALVSTECEYSAGIDLSTDAAQTVFNGPCVLYGIYVDTVLSAHACPILDGSTTVFSLVASLAAGTNLHWPNGIRFNSTLAVNSNDSGTGTIVFLYRPLNPTI